MPVPDNTGSDSFGTTTVGTPVTKTFTVINNGTQTLTLSAPITLPSGFTLASTFGSTALAPGASTTFKVTLSAATAGSYSGTLSFGTNDPSNNPYSFTISGTVNSSSGTSATLTGTDTTTEGSWQGTYGGDGYNVIGDQSSYPSYAQVGVSGQSSWTWAASTTDVRALQKASNPASRVAAAWYAGSNFTVDVNLTDGKAHQVSLYALDWDGNNGRSERIDVLDAATGGVLSSQTVSSFSNGEYVSWNASGHVQFRVTALAGANAVLSGLFFEPATGPALASTGTTASENGATPSQPVTAGGQQQSGTSLANLQQQSQALGQYLTEVQQQLWSLREQLAQPRHRHHHHKP
jgi:hypothetical protein